VTDRYRSTWWAGVSSESLAMWPKTEMCMTRYDTRSRPVDAKTSEFHMVLQTDLGYLVLALRNI